MRAYIAMILLVLLLASCSRQEDKAQPSTTSIVQVTTTESRDTVTTDSQIAISDISLKSVSSQMDPEGKVTKAILVISNKGSDISMYDVQAVFLLKTEGAGGFYELKEKTLGAPGSILKSGAEMTVEVPELNMPSNSKLFGSGGRHYIEVMIMPKKASDPHVEDNTRNITLSR